MEEVVQRQVQYLFENVTNRESGGRACSLVRFYRTYPYESHEPELQEFAEDVLGSVPEPGRTRERRVRHGSWRLQKSLKTSRPDNGTTFLFTIRGNPAGTDQ